MIAYKKEKKENAMCYFAAEHYNKTGGYLPQTTLFKYLAYLDFMSLIDIGKPALELEYKAMGNGPVPHKIYNMRKNLKTRFIEFVDRGNGKYIVKARRSADLDYFSKYEIGKMNELIEKYADPQMKEKEIANRICKDSHKDIRAWEMAWGRKKNSLMKYEDTFESLCNKTENELSPAEENFLLYQH